MVGKKVEKVFDKFKALDEIDIEIQPGTAMALIGPSGAGKSTLIRALSLIDPPTRGEIDIDGVIYRYPSIKGDRPPIPWPRITVVFQQLFLWPHLTLRENIELPISQIGIQDCWDRAKELIELFELKDYLSRLPYQASIGQRQRVAIVRALALRPKYLLLDEVTSALDVEQVSRLVECINRLRNEGSGVVIVTHLLGFARLVADYFMFIDRGQCVEKARITTLDNPVQERVREFVSFV